MRHRWGFLLLHIRETFQDSDSVRVHPIITKGGNLVNVVPDEVVIETLVRAGNKEAIIDADTSGLHSVDFDIVDEELAYIVTAKIFALSAYRLLKNGAVKAKKLCRIINLYLRRKNILNIWILLLRKKHFLNYI